MTRFRTASGQYVDAWGRPVQVVVLVSDPAAGGQEGGDPVSPPAPVSAEKAPASINYAATYTVAQLKALCTERGLNPVATGKRGRFLEADYIAALEAADRGAQ